MTTRPQTSHFVLATCAALACTALAAIAHPGQGASKASAASATVERPRWLAVDRLQGSGIAIVGSEVYVANDRAGADANTIEVFNRNATGESSPPVRKIVLDVSHPAIADPAKKKYYEVRVCKEGATCDPLDIEDLAVDGAGAIYVSVEGRPDCVIKFDPKSYRAVDVWGDVTGDQGNLGAEGLAVTPDGTYIFVGHQHPAEISVINTKTTWVSKGPIEMAEICGLAYDGAKKELLVLDATVPEIVRITLDGRVLERYAIGTGADLDPSGKRYVGVKFDAIALGPAGNAVWLVTDPPHDPSHPYGPADKGATVPDGFVKGYSMLYRVRLGR